MKIISQNKKAHHDYFLLDTYEAGIELKGTEIKSVRLGNVNLKDSFVRIKNDEVYVENMHIAPYDHGNIFNHEARRTRKLLLHKKEILKITNKLKEGGLTVVPTKMYFSGSKAKLEIALAKGKKLYDKRNDLKEKAAIFTFIPSKICTLCIGLTNDSSVLQNTFSLNSLLLI